MNIPSNDTDWVESILLFSKSDERLVQACREAAVKAAALRLVRRNFEEREPDPGPIRDVLDAVGGVDVAKEWAGLDVEQPVTPRAARAWGQFAAAIGMLSEEAATAFRLTLAEAAGAPVELGLSRARGPLPDREAAWADAAAVTDEACRSLPEEEQANIESLAALIRESFVD